MKTKNNPTIIYSVDQLLKGSVDENGHILVRKI